MKRLMITMTALPALAMVTACGPDSPREELGDRMEEQADAIEDVGNERAEMLEERADEAATDAREDMLNERAEEIDDIGDEAADEINDVADELE
ncbi:hypothetical protein [Erythrobacter sp.]|uniref:hypothetical protein n=1 Tax=Erythrobacter sp. TaxID=1042 RepID=UPI0014260011|nr:hypothetical protein [Erythrobacter sp.]QIQ85575.1 MAG: hypothetical protein G9473_01920 [Erythrobacter sp.]